MTNEVKSILRGIGQRYGYLDDSWPDMEDDMTCGLMDELNISETSAERLVDEFINHPEWFY